MCITKTGSLLLSILLPSSSFSSPPTTTQFLTQSKLFSSKLLSANPKRSKATEHPIVYTKHSVRAQALNIRLEVPPLPSFLSRSRRCKRGNLAFVIGRPQLDLSSPDVRGCRPAGDVSFGPGRPLDGDGGAGENRLRPSAPISLSIT